MHQPEVNQPEIDPATSSSIAVVGIGCHYPGATNPQQLWENVLGRRQEFRRFLDQRLPCDDYCDTDPNVPDKVYAVRAAYIDGLQFDWATWRIPKSTFDSTDIVQWLTLEVVHRALEDAGYNRETVPQDRTGVVLGNTLTGEQSRAGNLRLRWPFVRRAFLAAAVTQGLPRDAQEEIVAAMETLYKSSFPEVTEDTLAGGLANTIAGRICNYFDLHGGGYIVDGACSSSLLAVCTAADHLINRDWDVAITGGVDISLDPFELVGFSKATALTKDDMHVYDKRGAGFIPGEGCGIVVLKRLADARAAGDPIYAAIHGWGVSSDGKGGITAPSSTGQSTALLRAYARAGYSPHTLDFIEGHGTGTRVGDQVELKGIASTLDAYGPLPPKSCGMTSFKSIVGHTKAAAGVGALIKTIIAVNRRILPPTAGCKDPNSVFDEEASSLYPILQGQIRSASEPLRAGVSAMGFGGINSHLTVESGDRPLAKFAPAVAERALLVHAQDSEILAVGAPSSAQLQQRLTEVAEMTALLSVGELTDLAAHLGRELDGQSPLRAAVVASRPDHAAERLHWLASQMAQNVVSAGDVLVSPQRDAWLGYEIHKTRLGFLLPGQGSQHLAMGRVLIERYKWARDIAEQADRCTLEETGRPISPLIYADLDRATEEEKTAWEQALAQTDIAQPAICLASVLYARYLERLGLRPAILGGHSLGELTAFHLAGAYDEEMLFRLAARRGRAMASTPAPAGSMASLACSSQQAEALIQSVSGHVVVANINTPDQVVISGEEAAVSEVLDRATRDDIKHRALRVSAAFHSQLMEKAADQLRYASPLPQQLDNLSATLLSCMDGNPVAPGLNLHEHFADQILAQVQFIALVKRMQADCDLMIEIGPGRVLSGLVNRILESSGDDCLPVASQPGTARDLNMVLAQAFVHGVDCNWEALYDGRLVRPLVPASERSFIDNPCERPFVQLDPLALAAPQSANGHLGALETTLLANTNMSPMELHAYLSRRQGFLADIVKSDLHWQPRGDASALQPVAVTAPLALEAPLAEPMESAPPTTSNEVQHTLIELIAQRTGFPVDVISLDARLLDDLNLDSIKAGEIVASVAKASGVVDQFDPSQFANATLSEITAAIQQLQGPAVEPHETSHRPQGNPVLAVGVEQMLIEAVAARTGFPADSISAQFKLLDDLNLDSIKAGELIASVAQQTGVADKLDPSSLANASLEDVAHAIGQAQGRASLTTQTPASVEPVQTSPMAHREPSQWVRNYAIQYVPQATVETPSTSDVWRRVSVLIVALDQTERVVSALRRRLGALGAQVVAVSLEADAVAAATVSQPYSHVIGVLPETASSDEDDRTRLMRTIEHLHTTVHMAITFQSHTVAFVQFGGGTFGTAPERGALEACGTAGFARSLHLDHPALRVRVIDLATAIEASTSAELIVQELTGEESCVTVGYETANRRVIPRAVLQEPADYAPRPLQWMTEHVILVTGGAKGITAECALALARATQAKFALVGSSPDPKVGDPPGGEIARTLDRFTAEGLTCRYYVCDLSNALDVQALVQRVREELGPIQAVVHGAGLNRARRVDQVEPEAALAEVSPKLLGGHYLCQALSDAPPQLFVGLTSIIGVAGMTGNAWYAFSNEMLDLTLRRFEATHPETTVMSIAYSVWGEAGMGVRMGIIDRLAQMGMGAIPSDEGVSRFVQLVLGDPGEQQVVVTAAAYGLKTWRTLTPALPEPAPHRFVEQVERVEPGVELVARAHLHPERDQFLRDHDFRGSLLLPTVFGLEAMAQCTLYMTGENPDAIARIEDIQLARPIVVDPQNGAEIELHALAEEQTPGGERYVRVGIRTEQTGFRIDHFAATFVLGPRPTEVETISLPEPTPLALNPQTELYGGLLFQGPLYQRMETIDSLDADHAVLWARAKASFEAGEDGFAAGSGSPFVIGDPFFRDVLLQSAQLPLAPNILLPIHIGCVERFVPFAEIDGSCRVRVSIKWQEGKEYGCDVVVTDARGTLIERLMDYRVRIVEEHPDGPTAAQLANPEATDQQHLCDVLTRQLRAMACEAPTVTLGYLPGLHDLTKEERHEYECPLIYRAVQAQVGTNAPSPELDSIKWFDSGKPHLNGAAPDGLDVSLSHDNQYCLCVVGRGPQGCDLEPVTARTPEDWKALLGSAHTPILTAMVQSGESIDQAGTRIWTAIEAVRKAAGVPEDVALSLHRTHGEAMLLQARVPDRSLVVLTTPIALTHGPQRIVALVVASDSAPMPHPPSRPPRGSRVDDFYAQAHGSRFTHDEEKGQVVYEYLFQPAFKDCSNLSRGAFFSSYLIGVGRVRELCMAEIGPQLVAQIATGDWGLVTNWAELRITGTASVYDRLLARFWLGTVHGSVIPIRCEICRILLDGSFTPVASVEQETTWVRVIGHGRVEPAPFPLYLASFLEQLESKNGQEHGYSEIVDAPIHIDLGPQRYAAMPSPEGRSVIASETFGTTLEDANLVGNIYYANYFIWQGRVRDHFLYTVAPDLMIGVGKDGEAFCRRSRLNYLRDAMPFDQIQVELSVPSVWECGAMLHFSYFRLLPDGGREKLAVGEHEMVWVTGLATGQAEAKPLPAVLSEAFMGSYRADSAALVAPYTVDRPGPTQLS